MKIDGVHGIHGSLVAYLIGKEGGGVEVSFSQNLFLENTP